MTATAVAPTGWRIWIAGTRPRTLGASVAPVLVGTAVAQVEAGAVLWGRAALAFLVALALQIGVNFANDYSDGVRGTDAKRSGPLRLTASGLASPGAVRLAAVLAFGLAAAAGLALALIVEPWLLVVGVAAIAAATLYTGGPKPYGYLGLGEVMVLVFFGFVATVGSAFVQIERVPAKAWWGSLVVGLLACAIILVNNIRDLDADAVAGKRTLAVRIGTTRARAVFTLLVLAAFVAVIPIGVEHGWALVALAGAPLAVTPVRLVRTSRDAPSLVRALVETARLQLVVAVLLAVGLWVS